MDGRELAQAVVEGQGIAARRLGMELPDDLLRIIRDHGGHRLQHRIILQVISPRPGSFADDAWRAPGSRLLLIRRPY